MPTEGLGYFSPYERVRQLTLQNIRQMECSVTLADPSLPDCPLIGCSEGFERITGYSKKEVVGRNCRFLSEGCEVEPSVRMALRTAATWGGDFVGLLQNRRKNGEVFQNFLRMTSLTVAGHRYVLGIQADVTHIRMNLKDEEQAEEVRRVAQRVFAENVDTWIQIQAQEFQRRLPVTYDEVIGDLLNSGHGVNSTQNLRMFAQVIGELVSSNRVDRESASAQRRGVAGQVVGDLSHMSGGGTHCRGGAPAKAQAERELAPTARQVLRCKNTFIDVLEDTQEGGPGLKRSASDSLLDRISSSSVDITVDPDMISTTSSEGLFGRASPMTESSDATPPFASEEPATNGDAGFVENGLRTSKTRRRRRRAAKNKDVSEPARPPAPATEAVMIKTNSVVKGVSWPASKARASNKEVSPQLTFLLNQQVHLPAQVDTEGLGAAEREILISGLTFTVDPPLPEGLSMDSHNGTIRGTLEETQERTEHVVTVSTCAKGPGGICLGSVPLVREKVSIRVEDLTNRYRICEVLEERDENGNEKFVVKYEAF